MLLGWLDLEMTGLRVQEDKILEMAIVITNDQLEEVPGGRFHAVINQPDSALDSMNDWCTEHHGQSGLTRLVRESQISLETAETLALEFLKEKCRVRPKEIMMTGNSIYMDKLFIYHQMPRLFDYFHYRIVDVSSIKELCRAWNPQVFSNVPAKALSHRAFDDILESIEELKFYRKNFFHLPPQKPI